MEAGKCLWVLGRQERTAVLRMVEVEIYEKSPVEFVLVPGALFYMHLAHQRVLLVPIKQLCACNLASTADAASLIR
jgi:hypothetical protein